MTDSCLISLQYMVICACSAGEQIFPFSNDLLLLLLLYLSIYNNLLRFDFWVKHGELWINAELLAKLLTWFIPHIPPSTIWNTIIRDAETKSYLRYFPPVKTIKKVVGAPLIGVGFQCRFHPGCPRYPNPLLFVIPPVSVKARVWNQVLNNKLSGIIYKHLDR